MRRRDTEDSRRRLQERLAAAALRASATLDVVSALAVITKTLQLEIGWFNMPGVSAQSAEALRGGIGVGVALLDVSDDGSVLIATQGTAEAKEGAIIDFADRRAKLVVSGAGRNLTAQDELDSIGDGLIAEPAAAAIVSPMLWRDQVFGLVITAVTQTAAAATDELIPPPVFDDLDLEIHNMAAGIAANIYADLGPVDIEEVERTAE